MARKRLYPVSERAKLDLERIGEHFHDVLEKLQVHERLSLPEIGIDWNQTELLKNGGSAILYNMAHNVIDDLQVGGKIQVNNNDETQIYVSRGASDMGRAGMVNDFVIGNLTEATSLVNKLEILEGTEFLPAGEKLEANGNGHPGGNSIQIDDERMRQFAYVLLNSAEKIFVGSVNEQFGDYIVARTMSGWYVAYNTNYGEGTYVVPDLDDLLRTKSDLLSTKDAITLRRDPRGPWVDRLKEYL